MRNKPSKAGALERVLTRQTTQRIGMLGAACLLCAMTPSAFSQVIYLAPPPPIYVAPPPPVYPQRTWRPGYWQMQRGNYVWQEGAWQTLPPPEAAYPANRPDDEASAPQVERLSTDTLFNFDRADVNDITEAGRADIAQIAERLRNGRFDHVEIRGFTDRLGSAVYNVQLSERRANAVKAMLVQQGIPASKIHAVGLGEQDPVAQCNGASGSAAIQCLQPNRRVEIVTYVTPEGYQRGGNDYQPPLNYDDNDGYRQGQVPQNAGDF